MEFIQNAGLYLISQGYTQGATKTTSNNYQKGTLEIILYDKSFIRRKVFQDEIFSQINFKNADLALLKKVIVKDWGRYFLGKDKW